MTPTPTPELSRDPAALRAEVRGLAAARAELDRRLALALRDLHVVVDVEPDDVPHDTGDDVWLTPDLRISRRGAVLLRDVARHLPDLPSCERALTDGRISLDQAGWIVEAARRLPETTRATFDERACALLLAAGDDLGEDHDVRRRLTGLADALADTHGRDARPRADGRCRGSARDHVVATQPAVEVVLDERPDV